MVTAGQSAASEAATVNSLSTAGLAIPGDPVRGAEISAVIDGLQQFEGQEVTLTLTPLETGSRFAYAIVQSAVVDESGKVTAAFRVPNALSGEDDIVPITPGGNYVLSIASQVGQGNSLLVPFPVAPAEPGTAYSVEVSQSTGECGFPLSWIAFDGQNWLPGGSTAVEGSGRPTVGALTLLDSDTARFEGGDGSTTTYLRAGTGWAC